MKALIISGMTLFLVACAGGGAKSASVAQYDLGVLEGVKSATPVPALALRSIDVHAPSWLSKSTMQYRLAYADSGRRDVYIESRWAAAPAELLEVALRRRLGAGESDVTTAGCRLRVELDEFVQVFDSTQASRAVIEARILLLAPRSDELLGRKNISVSKPAASADARGGVAAFSALAAEMGGDMTIWLTTLLKDDSNLVKRCRTN